MLFSNARVSLFAVSVWLLILVCGCTPPPPEREKTIVLDATVRTNLLLVADSRGSVKSAIHLKMDGWIDGVSTVKLEHMELGKLTGQVKWEYSTDYFDDSGTLTYTPSNVTTGVFVIRYRIF